MVKTLALGFGLATAVAVAGSMTPTGQAMLGLRHPAEKATNVTVIQDKPAAIPAPAAGLVPVSSPVRAQPSSSAPQPQSAAQSRAVPPSAQPAPQPRGQAVPQQRGQAVPQQQGGQGGLAGVANILLNLPQVLDQTRVGPARGQDSWSESKPADSDEASQEPAKIYKKKHREQKPERYKDPGEDN